MSDTATCPTTDAPPPPPEIQRDIDVWNPGGDPGELRRAAEAWRDMADVVEDVAGNLDAAVGRCLAQWHGPAADAFAAQWREVHDGMADDVVPHLREIAGKLDETAAVIEEINDRIHDLYVSIGVAVGVGAVLSVVTLGFSAAAGAAAAATAAAQAGLLVQRMAVFLTSVANLLRAAQLTRRYAKAWAVAAAVNTGATGITKIATNPNHDPFDGWTLDDLTGIVNGSTAGGLTMGAGGSLLAAGRVAPAVRHPFLTAGALGGAGNSGGSVLDDVVGGDPIDWTDAGVNGAAGFVGGSAGARLAHSAARLRAWRQSRTGATPPPPAPAPAAAPPPSGLVVPGPAPAGYRRTPSGLLVPDGGLPPGFVAGPSGLAIPEPAPAGWHGTPSGLVVPGPPPAAAPTVTASALDDLFGGILGESPVVGGAGALSDDEHRRTGQPLLVCR